jgi:hypothetical protein
MPDFQPTSEVIRSSPFITSVFNHTPLYWSWFYHFCRIQYLPHFPGQSPIRSKAQSLLWDVDLLLWLNWCIDMPC